MRCKDTTLARLFLINEKPITYNNGAVSKTKSCIYNIGIVLWHGDIQAYTQATYTRNSG